MCVCMCGALQLSSCSSFTLMKGTIIFLSEKKALCKTLFLLGKGLDLARLGYFIRTLELSVLGRCKISYQVGFKVCFLSLLKKINKY